MLDCGKFCFKKFSFAQLMAADPISTLRVTLTQSNHIHLIMI